MNPLLIDDLKKNESILNSKSNWDFNKTEQITEMVTESSNVYINTDQSYFETSESLSNFEM